MDKEFLRLNFNIPKLEFPKIPEIKAANLSSSEIKAMTDDEIIAILTGEKNVNGILPLATQKVLTNELLTRSIKRASKPHWTIPVGFWIAVIAMIAACIAAYPVLFPAQASRAALEAPKPVQTIQPAQNKPSNLQQQSIDSQAIPKNKQQK